MIVQRIFAAFVTTVLLGGVALGQTRPAITGISHMCVLSHDMGASADFYGRVLGASKGVDPQDSRGMRFYFSPTQFVEVLPLPSDAGMSRMGCVAWNTANARGLRGYLQAKGVQPLSEVKGSEDGSQFFSTKDPEGNVVEFVQPGRATASLGGSMPISHRVIHVGFAVKDRAAEDRFYKDVFGFRPYWYGASKPDHVDWISQQVPDGHDWLEYMMTDAHSDTDAAKIDARQLGVLNHFSLGVPNMEAAVTTLIKGDRLSPRHDGPQMGKDGKWQANLYDPDGTRVELMEFYAGDEALLFRVYGGQPYEVERVEAGRAWVMPSSGKRQSIVFTLFRMTGFQGVRGDGFAWTTRSAAVRCRDGCGGFSGEPAFVCGAPGAQGEDH